MVKPRTGAAPSLTKTIQLYAVVNHSKAIDAESKDRLSVAVWFCTDVPNIVEVFKHNVLQTGGYICLDNKQLTFNKASKAPLSVSLTTVSPDWDIKTKQVREFAFQDVWALSHQSQTFILENPGGYGLPFCSFEVKQRSQRECIQLQCHMQQHKEEIMKNPLSPGLLTEDTYMDFGDEVITSSYWASFVASKVLDHTGGDIHVPNTDVSLHVPPGALEDGQTEEISIAILPGSEISRPNEMQFGIMSSIVRCLPSHIRFRKPVTLSLPHCVAVKDSLPCRVNVYKNHEEPGNPPVWKQLNSSECSSAVGKKTCKIYLQEFCDICADVDCDGECGEQLIMYALGRPLANKLKKSLIVSIYFCREILDVKKRLEIGRQNEIVLCENTFLFSRKVKSNLKISLDRMTPEWSLLQDHEKVQEFDFNNVLCLPWQHVTFTLYNPEGNNMPYCKFSVWQEGEGASITKTNKVALKFETQVLLSHTAALHGTIKVGGAKFKQKKNAMKSDRLKLAAEQVMNKMKQVVSIAKLMELSLQFHGPWKPLAANVLKLTAEEITQCEAPDKEDLAKVYNAFRKWREKNGIGATAGNLMELLQKHAVNPDVWRVLEDD